MLTHLTTVLTDPLLAPEAKFLGAAPGMHFEPLAFEISGCLSDCCQTPDAPPNRFYAYGVVARLAQLAASLELERTAPKEE